MEVHFAPPIFQSTPPVKAATPAACSPLQAYRFQSTPPVKAATLYLIVRLYQIRISIHAAREGGDWNAANTKAREVAFQSTPPVKAATTRESHVLLDGEISIHAAREGGDPSL